MGSSGKESANLSTLLNRVKFLVIGKWALFNIQNAHGNRKVKLLIFVFNNTDNVYVEQATARMETGTPFIQPIAVLQVWNIFTPTTLPCPHPSS